MVARPVFDRLKQREDLPLAQNRSANFCSCAGPWIAAPALNGRYPIRVANDSRCTARADIRALNEDLPYVKSDGNVS
jgi:hypothetical protein